MQKFTFLLTTLTLFCQIIIAQERGDLLFSNSSLHEIRISSDSEPDLYQNLQQEAMNIGAAFSYHLVNVEIDGETIDSVGVRVKGFLSTTGPQTPLKIDFNEYVPGKNYDKIKKVNLNNSFNDPTKQKDRLAYEIFRTAGVSAPRTSYAEVFVNNEFAGVYVLVEQVDKSFINDHYASDEGSLYKIFSTVFGTNVFDQFLNGTDEAFLEQVNQRQYFKYVLLNLIVGGQDNYPSSPNNFYIYYNIKEKLFHYMPWDHNLAFEIFADDFNNYTGLFPDQVQLSLWNTPELREAYLEIACELKHYLFDETRINNFLDDTKSVIESNSQNVTVSSPHELADFLKSRLELIESEFLAEGFSCNTFEYPLNMGDLVINEFVAKSDSIGGIQEPDGGTPDWIELYNNSDKDIVLNHHFYLSDDIDYLKKWNFKTEITIPANAYQIVWADRDIHQQGVHSNFKLSKEKGDLILSYEDLTVIDQVSYAEQELNKAYARIPNGTGSFIIQDPSFNANNNGTTSTSNSNTNTNILVYPNPANETLHIKTASPIQQVEIISVSGQSMYKYPAHTNQINLSELPTGIYFLTVLTQDQNQTIRFIKN